ncbi:MAG: ABC-F family ATP-binding cassette domain-containing protein [Deltaproteobacteria bacterium]|nr:ABC-F family ATP-binding cassette domain-containing protein [Deltaproteobacteria bacterium]
MVDLQNIHLTFMDRVLFDGINWTIAGKSRIGLVGDNGVGKTTLLRVILGEVEPDQGKAIVPARNHRMIGYLPQDVAELEHLPLMDYLKRQSGIAGLEESIARCEADLRALDPDGSACRAKLRHYEKVVNRYQAIDGYAFEAKAKQILRGFGFLEKDFGRLCTHFSGGWKMRILLSVILLSCPDIMLLDEPTNHLDTESMEWLENYLRDYRGCLIAISHDHMFLDKMVQQIAELARGKLTLYKGNYTDFLKEKERRLEMVEKSMVRQQEEIRRVERFVERFRYKATKAAQVRSRVKMLEKMDVIQLEKGTRSTVIRFPVCEKSGKEVATLHDVAKRYDSLSVFSGINLTLYRGERVAFVGINGAGKSTLFRLLAGVEEPTCGSVNLGLNVRIAFFSQESADNLHYERAVWEEVQSVPSPANDQQRRDLLGAFLFSGDDIYKSIAVLSGGEKSRLALLKMLLKGSNFLVLDEPTNHLDLKTKEIFQEALLRYEGTLAIVSHDRYFLDRLVDRVVELKEGRALEYRGDYSYFIEKRCEFQEIALPLPKEGHDDPNARQKDYHGYKSREAKRREAEERNRLSRRLKPLKEELTSVEARIAELERLKQNHEEEMCRPDTHKKPGRTRALTHKLTKAHQELEGLYDQWADIMGRIEEEQVEPR